MSSTDPPLSIRRENSREVFQSAAKTSSGFFAFCHAQQTPSIVYDVERLRATARLLAHLTRGFGECYFAVKANRNPSVLSELAKLGFGADVASEAELSEVQGAGFETFSATSPGLTRSMARSIDALKGTIYFDNISQIASAVRDGVRLDRHGVRLSMPGKYEHFGFADLAAFSAMRFSPTKFHFHAGEITCFEELQSRLRVIRDWIDGMNPTHVNWGGGFGVISNVAFELERALEYIAEFSRSIGAIIIFEFGKVVVARSGVLVVTIIGRKRIGGIQVLIVDACSTNLCTWERWPICKRGMMSSSWRMRELIPTKIVGNSCYERDIFIEHQMVPEMDVGEKILLANAGAYSSSVGGGLHGLPPPEEIFFGS